MRIKNLSPFLIGAKVTSRRPPQPEMMVVVKATFVLAPGAELRVPDGPHPLSQGSLTAEVFAEDDDEREGECLYPGDFADYKLNAEVMLKGTCHVPGGRPAVECPVRFSVGDWSKNLRVVGPRAWVDDALGGAITAPLPFTAMELSYKHAFGGAGYAPNPVGRGVGTRELPTIERPGDVILARSDRPSPGGFGPINPAWAERAQKRGTMYGEAYQKTRAPFYAEDLDWTHFHAAPSDQQLSGYLRGDEEVTFQNLHPASPLFSVRLPALRVRAFARESDGRAREVPLSLDTLFADLDQGRLVLLWRGLIDVRDDDLAGVTSLLAASEPLREPPSDAARYLSLLEAFERDPTGIDDHAPALKDMLPEPPSPGAPEPPDPVSKMLADKLGGLALAEQEQVRRAMASLSKALSSHGVDVGAAAANAARSRPGPAPSASPSDVAPPKIPIGAAVRTLLDRARSLKALAGAQGVAIPGLDAIEALANDPRIRALVAGAEAPSPPPAPGPGANLADRDLRGEDLSDKDLSGADLSGANLSFAKLARAKLTSASLARAILFEADLSGADLSGANLSLANLSGADARGARLSGAVADGLNASRAVLRGADLTGVKGEGAIFDGADLTGADARGAELSQATFDGATLEGASLAGARLIKCRLLSARARGIDLERAVLTGSSFDGADLTEAKLVEAEGEGVIFRRATLRAADLSYASLPKALMVEIKAEQVILRAADLPDVRLYRASLAGADASKANLLRADLCKTSLRGARFSGANLYDAKLLGASGEGCDFSGANLLRVTPSPEEVA